MATFMSGVLKANIPRSDLKMTIQGMATPTPFGFGGWVALSKGHDGADVMMGDLVLTLARSESSDVRAAGKRD
jgi:hypothetical protein